MYVCMYVYIYIYIFTHIYIRTCIYVHTWFTPNTRSSFQTCRIQVVVAGGTVAEALFSRHVSEALHLEFWRSSTMATI